MTDTLLDRFIWFALGSIFGFILGWTVQSLNNTKNAVNKLNKKLEKLERNEDGFMRHPYVADVLYLLVLVIVVWSAFQAQIAANNSERLVNCNRTVLNDTLTSLNGRATYTVDQLEANLELQKAQGTFLAVVSQDPPAPEPVGRRALEDYIAALTDFTTASAKQSANIKNNPLPSNDALKNCLNGVEDRND
jgi:cell division protein FtsB